MRVKDDTADHNQRLATIQVDRLESKARRRLKVRRLWRGAESRLWERNLPKIMQDAPLCYPQRALSGAILIGLCEGLPSAAYKRRMP